MNFSQVKILNIPEGSVKRIIDSQNRVLWSKQGIKTWILTYSHTQEYVTVSGPNSVTISDDVISVPITIHIYDPYNFGWRLEVNGTIITNDIGTQDYIINITGDTTVHVD